MNLLHELKITDNDNGMNIFKGEYFSLESLGEEGLRKGERAVKEYMEMVNKIKKERDKFGEQGEHIEKMTKEEYDKTEGDWTPTKHGF